MRGLLIIDMLVDFIDSQGVLYIGPTAQELVVAVDRELTAGRARGDQIIYICDRHLPDDSEFIMFPPHALEDNSGSAIIPELAPISGERIIYKRRYSAFFGTDLDLTLREKGIKELTLVGCVTNICILYTAADARMLNYQVDVPVAAVAGFDQEAHQFALQEMKKTLGVNLI